MSGGDYLHTVCSRHHRCHRFLSSSASSEHFFWFEMWTCFLLPYCPYQFLRPTSKHPDGGQLHYRFTKDASLMAYVRVLYARV